MCQSRFIYYNRCTSVVGDVDNGIGRKYKAEDLWEISLLSAQLCCQTKPPLKI